MKKSSLGLGAIALVAGLTLTACGGDSADDLASDYCDIVKDIDKATKDGDTDKLESISKEVTEWAKDHKDSDVDGDDFAKAVKDECGQDVPGL